MAGRAEIEFLNGGHTINALGTLEVPARTPEPAKRQ